MSLWWFYLPGYINCIIRKIQVLFITMFLIYLLENFLSLLQKRWFVPFGKPLLSRFPNRERKSGTKGGALLSRVWQPGQKRTFCPGWWTKGQPGQKVFFFMFSFSRFFFYFNYTFAFQLNLCIGIQCVRAPLIYTYILLLI